MDDLFKLTTEPETVAKQKAGIRRSAAPCWASSDLAPDLAQLPILSIRQPWAWLICHGGKDIENRSWPSRFRGKFLVHASKGMTRDEYEEASWTADDNGVDLPPYEQLERGGIVGVAEIVDCVNRSESPWFFGEYGFVLRNAKPLPFHECKGALGFFRLPNAKAQTPPDSGTKKHG
jgi:hypothetical protein